MNREPDWSLWRSFAAVVEHGSLSGAARALGLSQPTLGRHVEALEDVLGQPLFERTLGGLKANAAALRLYEPVRLAQQALAQASMVAEGALAEPGGTVRVTASDMVSNYVLPRMLRSIRERHPSIAIEIVPSDSAENLLLREADIAIRMFRPTQLELVTRRLEDIPLVPCVHESYVARRGLPKTREELIEHDLVGFDRSDLIIAHARNLGMTLTREHFALRTDDQTVGWEMIKAGLGIGFSQAPLVALTPGMIEVPLDLSPPPLEVWLTTHKELFTSHRIRAVYDILAAELSAYVTGSV